MNVYVEKREWEYSILRSEADGAPQHLHSDNSGMYETEYTDTHMISYASLMSIKDETYVLVCDTEY